MFNELQLQQFWYKQSVSTKGLKTLCGKPLSVIDPGIWNNNQGPDFTFSKIKIGEVEWVGNVEIHIFCSDWFKHKHEDDINYARIILHVVWKNDVTDFVSSPVLELSNFIDPCAILNNFQLSKSPILSCSLADKLELDESAHKEIYKMGEKRIERKKARVLDLFQACGNDFSSVLWLLVFRSFGSVQNAGGFESLFNSIPIHLLRLYGYDSFKLNALLFGQAKLIDQGLSDSYPQSLWNEYLQLQKKFKLVSIIEQMYFLRMRPRNFPTIRLAQLSAFYNKNMSLTSVLLQTNLHTDLFKLFQINHHDYWYAHYLFDRKSSPVKKQVGQTLIHQTILNAFIPFLLAYGQFTGDKNQVQKAKSWLAVLGPEINSLSQAFLKLGFRANSVGDTQGIVEVYQSLCLKNLCALCPRGSKIQLKNFTN
jgi:hypothetical protein